MISSRSKLCRPIALSAGAALALASGQLAAQFTVVNPPSAGTAEGNTRISFPFAGSVSNLRYQQIIGTSATTGAVGNIIQVAFRRDNVPPPTVPAGYASYAAWSPDFTMTLSTSPRTTQTISNDFTRNLGADATVVHTGQVNWPAANQAPGPAPWSYAVPVTTPFFYLFANGDLAIEIITQNSLNPNAGFFLDADSSGAGGSTSRALGGPCPAASNSTSFFNNWGPGTWARALLFNGPGNVPSFLALGTTAPTWLGLLLPVDLGVVGAPGCFVQHDIAIGAFSATTTSSGRNDFQFEIPNLPQLGGVQVRAQFINPFDPGAGSPASWPGAGNPLGWSLSAGAEITLSTPTAGSPAQSEAHASYPAGGTPGTIAQLVQQGYGAVVQLTFQ